MRPLTVLAVLCLLALVCAQNFVRWSDTRTTEAPWLHELARTGQPEYEWRTVASKEFALQPTQAMTFSGDSLPSKLRYEVRASYPVNVVGGGTCTSSAVLRDSRECDNASVQYFEIRDARTPTPGRAVVSALQLWGHNATGVTEMTANNRVSIKLEALVCVRYCRNIASPPAQPAQPVAPQEPVKCITCSLDH